MNIREWTKFVFWTMFASVALNLLRQPYAALRSVMDDYNIDHAYCKPISAVDLAYLQQRCEAQVPESSVVRHRSNLYLSIPLGAAAAISDALGGFVARFHSVRYVPSMLDRPAGTTLEDVLQAEKLPSGLGSSDPITSKITSRSEMPVGIWFRKELHCALKPYYWWKALDRPTGECDCFCAKERELLTFWWDMLVATWSSLRSYVSILHLGILSAMVTAKVCAATLICVIWGKTSRPAFEIPVVPGVDKLRALVRQWTANDQLAVRNCGVNTLQKDNEHAQLALDRSIAINWSIAIMHKVWNAIVMDVCGVPSRYNEVVKNKVVCITPNDINNYGVRLGLAYGKHSDVNVKLVKSGAEIKPYNTPVLLSLSDWYYSIDELCLMFSNSGGVILTVRFEEGPIELEGASGHVTADYVEMSTNGGTTYKHGYHRWEDQGLIISRNYGYVLSYHKICNFGHITAYHVAPVPADTIGCGLVSTKWVGRPVVSESVVVQPNSLIIRGKVCGLDEVIQLSTCMGDRIAAGATAALLVKKMMKRGESVTVTELMYAASVYRAKFGRVSLGEWFYRNLSYGPWWAVSPLLFCIGTVERYLSGAHDRFATHCVYEMEGEAKLYADTDRTEYVVLPTLGQNSPTSGTLIAPPVVSGKDLYPVTGALEGQMNAIASIEQRVLIKRPRILLNQQNLEVMRKAFQEIRAHPNLRQPILEKTKELMENNVAQPTKDEIDEMESGPRSLEKLEDQPSLREVSLATKLIQKFLREMEAENLESMEKIRRLTTREIQEKWLAKFPQARQKLFRNAMKAQLPQQAVIRAFQKIEPVGRRGPRNINPIQEPIMATLGPAWERAAMLMKQMPCFVKGMTIRAREGKLHNLLQCRLVESDFSIFDRTKRWVGRLLEKKVLLTLLPTSEIGRVLHAHNLVIDAELRHRDGARVRHLDQFFSGEAGTSEANGLFHLFMKWICAKIEGISLWDNIDMLRIEGDDGLDGLFDSSTFIMVSWLLGLDVKIEDGDCLLSTGFLGRSHAVTNGVVISYSDLWRCMRKFHLSARPPGKSGAQELLKAKAMSYLASDYNTPWIGAMAWAHVRRLSNVVVSREVENMYRYRKTLCDISDDDLVAKPWPVIIPEVLASMVVRYNVSADLITKEHVKWVLYGLGYGPYPAIVPLPPPDHHVQLTHV